jgi:hypothetical protein
VNEVRSVMPAIIAPHRVHHGGGPPGT